MPTHKFQQLSVPETAHPLVRELWRHMNDQRAPLRDVAEKAGVGYNAMVGWRTRRLPRIDDLEACFNVLGYTLRPSPLQVAWSEQGYREAA